MCSRILKKEEREQIEKIVNRILKPIEGKVSISKNYTVIHCFQEDSTRKMEWDEYWYRIEVKTDKGDYEYGDKFDESPDSFYLPKKAWNMAWIMFHKFDDNIHSPLAENLWPESNDHKPDYNKFL